jgi:D-sedoheptulose 7-phosphate isomerase
MSRTNAAGADAAPSSAMAPDLTRVIDDYLVGVARAIDELSRTDVSRAVELLVTACRAGRRVYVFGNGGSAATASHMVNDLNKQALVPGAPPMRAIALTDNVPLITAWSNDEDYTQAFVRQLTNFVEPGDVAVGISTSGNSENVLRALVAAREAGAVAIGMTGDVGGRLPACVDCCLYVPSADIGQQEDGHLVLNHVIARAVAHRLGQG